MTIAVPGQITHAVGRHLQLVARFSFAANGQMLGANPQEHVYRDATSLVAVGTPDITIMTDAVDLAPFYFSIPYYALNLVPTNGQTTYQINVVVSAYVNSFQVFQTQPSAIAVVW
jgi:hypothetical protein